MIFWCRHCIWLDWVLSDALPGASMSYPQWPECDTVAACSD